MQKGDKDDEPSAPFVFGLWVPLVRRPAQGVG
jgi:hypothetical protein